LILQFLKCTASTRPAAERVTFFACAKKVTKESTPPAARSPGILPSDFASVLRWFADSTSVCWQRTGAHPARHPTGIFLRTLAAPQGAPFRRLPAAEATATARFVLVSRRKTCVTQCRDARFRGSTRCSRCRASQPAPDEPEGARRWIAALAKQYMDVLSEPPGVGEKRRAPRRA